MLAAALALALAAALAVALAALDALAAAALAAALASMLFVAAAAALASALASRLLCRLPSWLRLSCYAFSVGGLYLYLRLAAAVRWHSTGLSSWRRLSSRSSSACPSCCGMSICAA